MWETYRTIWMQIHAPLQQRKTVKIFTSTGKVLPSAPKGTLSVLFFVILLSNLRESANELRGKIYTRDKHMNTKKCSRKVFFTYFSESESLSCSREVRQLLFWGVSNILCIAERFFSWRFSTAKNNINFFLTYHLSQFSNILMNFKLILLSVSNLMPL